MSHDNVLGMTAGTVCVSVAAGKLTTNWLTWRCRADCSRTVLLRPETLDRRRLTVRTAESVNGSIRQSGVLVDQTRRQHGPTNWGSVVSLHAEPCMSEQNSHFVQYPFWSRNQWRLISASVMWSRALRWHTRRAAAFKTDWSWRSR